MLRALNEASVDTLSKDPVNHTVHAVITGGRKLGASVQHVFVDMPGERFNVAVTLDGKPHLRMSHLDLDIYLETSIDDHVYVLHCFRETDNGSVSAPGEQLRARTSPGKTKKGLDNK